MKKICFVLSFLLMTAVLITAWSEKPCSELEKNIIRLHVIANSDEVSDQELKLKVRDAVRQLASEHSCIPSAAKMELTANEILQNAGVSYGARVALGKFYITRRSYGGFTLPFGKYTAARIELGCAAGQNWWCVLTPPLCFTESSFSTDETLDEYVSEKTGKIIKGDSVNIKFKTLELISRIKQKIEASGYKF